MKLEDGLESRKKPPHFVVIVILPDLFLFTSVHQKYNFFSFFSLILRFVFVVVVNAKPSIQPKSFILKVQTGYHPGITVEFLELDGGAWRSESDKEYWLIFGYSDCGYFWKSCRNSEMRV